MAILQTLYRPVGLKELELIRESGMTAFPPRRADQPIFYPVLNREYARQIAEQWNTKDAAGRATLVGFVTEFDLPADYVRQFPKQTVGSSIHQELWVPAEQLLDLNRHIVGPIRVTDAFYGSEHSGQRFDLRALAIAYGAPP